MIIMTGIGAQIILVPFGAFWIVLGILMQQKGFPEWTIRFTNSINGVKTEVTKNAITLRRVLGVIWIIVGSVLIITAFTVFS